MIPDFKVMRKRLAREQEKINCVIDYLKGPRLIALCWFPLGAVGLQYFGNPSSASGF